MPIALGSTALVTMSAVFMSPEMWYSGRTSSDPMTHRNAVVISFTRLNVHMRSRLAELSTHEIAIVLSEK
jgi:hypothetical protein